MDTRDLALFLPFRAALGTPNQVIGLPTLVWHFMRRKMTMDTDSSEISRAAMDLYRSHQKDWEGMHHSFHVLLEWNSLTNVHVPRRPQLVSRAVNGLVHYHPPHTPAASHNATMTTRLPNHHFYLLSSASPSPATKAATSKKYPKSLSSTSPLRQHFLPIAFMAGWTLHSHHPSSPCLFLLLILFAFLALLSRTYLVS